MQQKPEDLAKRIGAIKYYCGKCESEKCPISIKINFDEDFMCALRQKIEEKQQNAISGNRADII